MGLVDNRPSVIIYFLGKDAAGVFLCGIHSIFFDYFSERRGL